MLSLVTLITAISWCWKNIRWRSSYQKKTVVGSVDANHSIMVTQFPLSWIENAASVFPVLLFVFVMRSFIFEPFQIPSGSMMPTLLIGDFIIVKKYAYGLKNPITQNTLIQTGHPKRGDIAVFKYPLNPKLDYIKRVIGLPGDHITYDPIHKRVTVNPSCHNNQSCDKIFKITYKDMQLSDFVQVFSRNRIGEVSNSFYQIPLNNNIPLHSIRLCKRQETLGNVRHSILNIPDIQDQVMFYYQQIGQRPTEWVVSDGHYFMMGDNRDNSADSRYWGFVPEKNLVGKATAIWMSFQKRENEWPTGIRLNRIGAIN